MSPVARANQCAATKPTGQRCPARAMIGTQLCYFHTPEYAEAIALARSRGGTKAFGTTPRTVLAVADLDCSNPDELRAFRRGIQRLVLTGEIEPSAARAAMECSTLVAADGKAAEASESVLAMTAALSKALREQA